MKHLRVVCFVALLPVVVVLVTDSVAVDKQQVNAFYSEFCDALKKPDVRTRELAMLVKKDRPAAEKCLCVVKEKLGKGGSQGEGFRLFHDRLDEVLVATKTGDDCSDQGAAKLVALGKRETRSAGDRIFLLENALRLCPEVGMSIYALLGDLYLEECQFGMAEDAYKKALQFGYDSDTEKLLRIAQNRGTSYAKSSSSGKVDDAGEILMAPVKATQGGIRRKVAIRTAIQTNQIFFAEWSAQIRSESIPKLKAVAEGIKAAFKTDPGFRIVIEGHTDERGSEERNLELSKRRAEAIKDHLVQKEGVDPSRLDTKGCGPWKPFSALKDESGWRLNRRVEFKKSELSGARQR